jgi:hypothetical protein
VGAQHRMTIWHGAKKSASLRYQAPYRLAGPSGPVTGTRRGTADCDALRSAGLSSPRTPTCQPTRNTRRSSRSPCALRVLSRRVRRMTPKRRKRRGESVPSPEQDKAEVVRAVLTRREIGVVTSAGRRNRA